MGAPVPLRHVAPTEPVDRLRVAMWSDGRLDIRLPGMSVLLSVEETRELVAYLDRVLLERVAVT